MEGCIHDMCAASPTSDARRQHIELVVVSFYSLSQGLRVQFTE